MQTTKEDKINILVVEDLGIAQVTAVRLFSKLGCKASVMESGTRALEHILGTHYDIIFIDIQLPDFNGFQLAQTIRGMERHASRIPLIAITANSTQELEAQSKQAGFDDFMLKPLTLSTARHMLRKHLNQAKSRLLHLDDAE